MRRALLIGLFLVGCGDASGVDTTPTSDELSGGATTVFDATSGAFAQPAPNLTGDRLAQHRAGDMQFEATFVTAPAPVNPGLGPLFNAASCRSCHVGDGRGRPPVPGEITNSILLRLSATGTDAHGAPAPIAGFGTQLQTRAVAGFTAEGELAIAWHDSAGAYEDGTPYTLRVPAVTIESPYVTLPGDLRASLRVAPPVFGMGLLEAVPEATIRAHADPDDADHDGISGRANEVWDVTRNQTAVGRFGLKANTASVLAQTVTAYHEDMGVTTSTLPIESCDGRTGCPAAVDVPDTIVALVAHYVRTLGVPARRMSTDSRAGEKLFRSIGCAGCHLSDMTTGALAGVPEVSGQRIHAWTDLLVHDMGPALADDRPDFLAGGAEWRTAPLWGVGLTEGVNGHTNFLHDGRARSLEEAILWHGGEGEASRERFRRLEASDRARLLAFLQSL